MTREEERAVCARIAAEQLPAVSAVAEYEIRIDSPQGQIRAWAVVRLDSQSIVTIYRPGFSKKRARDRRNERRALLQETIRSERQRACRVGSR
jgi:hypothetical protein